MPQTLNVTGDGSIYSDYSTGEREEEVKERDGERERESREAGWESNHTFESRPLPARE
jgi:hypothetical protein